ncbi:MAG: HAMP domain-containing protein [Rhizobiales bacterium]|nr:HAMP domain-containing protein [Hyphomicrobiales bacterium]
MRRLYQKIYLTIIASLVVVVLVAGAIWRFGSSTSPAALSFEIAAEFAAAALPPASAPRSALKEAVNRLAGRLDADVGVFDRKLGLIATAGWPLPPPRQVGPDWSFGRQGATWTFPLPDERWLVVRPHVPRRHPALHLVLFLGVIALGVALCAFPVVRGLTRRIERLQTGVETLGAGNLSARVKVEGRDEVARLAESFNRAAARIEDLVGAHRMLLANASHELRTPLSRIRLGLELFQQNSDPKYKTEVERDIAELDLLIDEILLTSRLDAIGVPQTVEDVDLLALAAEECARYGCAAEGQSAPVGGDPRLLRRLIRNLLENAKRHGKPPMRAEVRSENGTAVLDVLDAGAGVPEAEREQVFAPFHQLGSDAKGVGLGLSLVRRIARLHGGDAVVVPRPDNPSCFRVTLPLVRA